MKLKHSVIKYTVICTICILTVSVFALLMIYNPFSDTSAPMAVQASDEEQATSKTADESKNTSAETQTTADKESPASSDKRQINIYLTEGRYHIHTAIRKYAQKHWNYKYEINFFDDGTHYSTPDIISMLNDSLINGDGAVDIYMVNGIYAQHYVKGDYSRYACTYKELGIDVDAAVKKADIPLCILDAGRNPDGEIIALPYITQTSVFLYRRSIARDVWGTDDPEVIGGMIGGGTQKWDKFFEAARTLKKNGYYIVPGFEGLSDMIGTCTSSAAQDPVSVNGIDPMWEEYMDVSKQLFDNGFIGDTRTWTDQWYNDLKGDGNKVFGIVTDSELFEYIDLGETSGNWAVCLPPFSARYDNAGIFVNKDSPNKDLLGPLVEWMTLDCSEEGLQYSLANGTQDNESPFGEKKMSVISGTVLKNTDGSRDILGGQNINTIVYEALKQPMGKLNVNYTFYYWKEAIDSYIKGEKSKKEAIEDFNFRKNTYMFAPNTLPDPKAAPDHAQQETIVWTDKNIESAVRKLLFKPIDDIYPSDAARVTGLDLTGMDIENLEDLLHLKNLTCLYLESSNISDISTLKELSKLELLDISINNITDISALGGLTKLRELYMNSNKINDISSLKSLSSLETLNVRNNMISDISSLEGKQNLKFLDASRNSISDIKALGGLSSLESLNLSDNEISDISPLNNLPMLRDLNLEYNEIKDINSLRTLKKLEALLLNGNKISDISSLKGLRSLNELRLSGSNIADRSPADHIESVTW